MDDKELLEQLARGPLTRNGFDEALRRKIHDRIDNPKRRSVRFWNRPWARASFALTLMLIVGLGLWSWQISPLSEANQADQLSTQSTHTTGEASASIAANTELRSAMLIGLRTDQAAVDGYSRSSYRTILVTPEDKQLTVVADGPGLYMPFGQKFWKVDAVTDQVNKGVQTLVSAPADQAGEFILRSESTSTPPLTEKLLFAGNRFVSIMQMTTAQTEGRTISASHLWVNEVSDLTLAKREGNSNVLKELHYTFHDSMGLENPKQPIEEWVITRDRGVWIAQQPSEPIENRKEVSMSSLLQIPTPLTEMATGPDLLTLPWEEITAIEQNAKDAYTSPAEDIVAIVVDGGIHLYPYKLLEEDGKPLKLETAANETIVMVHWALNGYVASWKKQLSGWIPPTASPGL
jgi:hypothetical protein